MNKILESLKRNNPKLALLDETPELISLLEEFKERESIYFWDWDGERYLYSETDKVIDTLEALEKRFSNSVFCPPLFKKLTNSIKEIKEWLAKNTDETNKLLTILEEKYKITSEELNDAITD